MADRSVRTDTRFSADEFIIPATDAQGHSARAQFRCVPELERQVEEVVSAKLFPFMTKGDLYRWAVNDGVHRLLAQCEEVPNFMGQIEMTNKLLRRKLKSAEFEKSIDLLAQTIGELLRVKARGEILSLMTEVKHQVKLMIDTDPFWGNRYMDELDTRFGHLVEAIEGEMPALVLFKPRSLGPTTEPGE